MKKSLLFLSTIFLLSNPCFSQGLSENNVFAVPSNNPGNLFAFDNAINFSSYIIPKNSGLSAIYASSLWCAALDETGSLHIAAGQYMISGHDFFNGPISITNAYADSAYTAKYGTLFSTMKYVVTKQEILNHISNFNQTGYVLPAAIANWPANGDLSVGVAQNLAPFVDMNNNNIYEPLLGDYPDIRGDKAVYQILNDVRNTHTETGGTPLGIEIHLMFYEYVTTDYKNDATFIHARIFNRGSNNYPAFKFGIWNDYLFGASGDDFVGCDTATNLAYVYKGVNNDGDSTFGYGANPPAFGMVSLNREMKAYGAFLNNSNLNPATAQGFYNFMNGQWENGASWLSGGNGTTGAVPTKFMLSGNPNIANSWNELSIGNSPGNRRTGMTVADVNLPSGAYACYDFAYLFSRETGNDNLQNVNSLIAQAALVKTDFDAMNYGCDLVTLGIAQIQTSQFELFPNPSNGSFVVSFGDRSVSGQIIVTDLNGRVVFEEDVLDENVKKIKLDNISGLFNVLVITDQFTVRKKLIINE